MVNLHYAHNAACPLDSLGVYFYFHSQTVTVHPRESRGGADALRPPPAPPCGAIRSGEGLITPPPLFANIGG